MPHSRNTRWKGLTVHGTVLFALSLLLIVSFLVTSLASYYASRRSILQGIIDTELPLTGDNVYSEIQKDIIQPIVISTMMAHDTFLRDWIVSGEGNVTEIRKYLNEIQRHYGAITAYFVSDATGNYYQTRGVLKRISPTTPHDVWFYRLKASPEDHVIEVDSDESNHGNLSIFINCRVNDYTGRFVGVTGIGLSVRSITAMINAYQKRYDRNVYFVDGTGSIVLAGDGGGALGKSIGTRLNDIPGLEHLTLRKSTAQGENFEYGELGKRHFINVRYIPDLKWFLVVDKGEVGPLSGVRHALYINLIICFISIIVALTLVFVIVRRYQVAVRDEESKRYEAVCALSHDLRSPHASILALIATHRSNPQSPEVLVAFERIERYTSRALELADDFVQLVRAETQSYQIMSVNIGELATDAVDEIHPIAQRKEISVSVHSPVEPCYASIDVDLVRRVFVNLLSNAVKYSGEGTAVEVHVRKDSAQTKFVNFIVRDQGYGISEEQRVRLFERFGRVPDLDRPYVEGSGLGLAFVKTVITRLGGRISMESTRGVGTTFIIWLPEAA